MRVLILLFVFSMNLFAQDKSEFHSYEIIIQADRKVDLSAWQLELTYDKSKLKITGIEGGAKPFSEPADYDARGMTAGKIILASYALKKSPASNQWKVAVIHFYGAKESMPKILLKIAADGKGKKVIAKTLLKKREKE